MRSLRAPRVGRYERSFRSRLVWPFAISVALNVVMWMALYPPLLFRPEARPRAVAVASIRLERRRRAQPRQRLRPPAPPHARTPKPPVPPVAIVNRHARPHHRTRKRPAADASNTLISAPNQVVHLKLPPTWANLDMGAATAEGSAIWLDFKKARGAFVPRILVMKLKTEYLSGPSLPDAVHDIVDGLHGENAQLLASNAQVVCGGKRPGWFLAYNRRTDDPPTDFDEILVLDGDTVYRISYSRPDGTPEDLRTRAALKTMCPLPPA